MKVKNYTLLLIEAIVWAIAGFNILHLGLLAYQNNIKLLNILLSFLVFGLFYFCIFSNMVKKHSLRIRKY